MDIGSAASKMSPLLAQLPNFTQKHFYSAYLTIGRRQVSHVVGCRTRSALGLGRYGECHFSQATITRLETWQMGVEMLVERERSVPLPFG